MKEYLGGERNCFFGVFDGHGSDGAKVSGIGRLEIIFESIVNL